MHDCPAALCTLIEMPVNTRAQVSAVRIEAGGRALLALVTDMRISLEGDTCTGWLCEPPTQLTTTQLLERLRTMAKTEAEAAEGAEAAK